MDKELNECLYFAQEKLAGLLTDIASSLKTIAERMPAKPGEFSTLWSADEPVPGPRPRRDKAAGKTKPKAVKQETIYDFLLTIDYLLVKETDSSVEAYAKWLVVLKLCCNYYQGVTANLAFSRVGLGSTEVKASKAKHSLRIEIERKVVQYKLDNTAGAKDIVWPYYVYGISHKIKLTEHFDSTIANSTNKALPELVNTLYTQVKAEADNTPWIAKPVESLLD